MYMIPQYDLLDFHVPYISSSTSETKSAVLTQASIVILK